MRRACSILTIIAMTLASSPVVAQPPPPSEAELRFREGVTLAKQNKPAEARAKYLQSYALEPRPKVLLSLALVENALGRPVDAVRHLRAYLASPEARDTDDLRATLLADLERATARLKIKAPPGTEIRLDGTRAGDALFGEIVDVEAGQHTVAAGTVQRDAVAVKGQIVEVDLHPAPPQKTTSAPMPAIETPIAPPPTGEPRWGTGQYVGLGFAGAGAITVGFGAGFLIAKGKSASGVRDLESLTAANGDTCAGATPSSACRDLQSKRHERDSYATTSTVLLVGGGLLLITGAVIFFVSPKKAVAGNVKPLLGLQSAGLELTF